MPKKFELSFSMSICTLSRLFNLSTKEEIERKKGRDRKLVDLTWQMHTEADCPTCAGEGLSLKQEMQKLLNYSEEEIDVDFSGPDTGRNDAASSPDKPTAK